MAGDEPRRSGRATKGQNKTLDEPADATPKSKKAAKSKEAKKAEVVEPEAQDEEPEDTIRCVCGDNTDDEAGRKFICCDACEAWQHNVCMGVSLEDSEQPEHYFCEQCRPEEHKELLEAMARGEPLWEERQKAAKSKKKGGKRGRKPIKSSKASDSKPELAQPDSSAQSATVEEPVPAEGSLKRKFEEEESPAKADATNGHAQEKATTPARADKRRKSSAKEAAAQDPDTALVDVSQLPDERKRVVDAIAKGLKAGTDSKVKSGAFTIPEGETSDSLSKKLASLIEYELHMTYHRGTSESVSEYATKFRNIIANIKKNPALCDRIINKTLSPADLAVMTTQDMASEELQRERKKMKEEADKQAIMIREEDDKPRVRRTHKGDEYVDESTTTGNVESVFTSKPVRRRESEVDGDGAGPGSPTGPTHSVMSPTVKIPHHGSMSEDQRRRSSSNFDIANVWAKTATSPDTEHHFSKPQAPSNGTAHAAQTTVQNKATGDADIDRLLADDDDNYTPADVKTGDGEIVWRGQLSQPGVTSLTVSARFVAGNDFSRFIPWSSFLPTQLEIEGRLERGKADDYLCGLQWSKRSDVTVLALTPYDNRPAFDTIFDYFNSRGRYAVGSKKYGCSDLVKDLYISPVEKGSKPPPHLELLDFSAIPSPATDRLLLATFVVNKPAAWDATDNFLPRDSISSRASLGGGPAGSPVNPQAPGFSPAPHHGFTPDNASHPQHLPPNPYAAAPEAAAHADLRFSPAALALLGPYAECPVAKQLLLATNGEVKEHEASNMRSIFDRNPESRDSMDVFARMLDG
ncbi:hypothetical protein ANO11243_078550 [Dothideomycetidae sp. 11243]|nr:hypothetical protein ANO11243_078550 [fungal sp. No.11243]